MIPFNPKARFLEMTDIAAAHRDMVVRSSFLFTVEMALLQYQRKLFLEASSDPVVAAAQAQRLCGAQQFLEELLNLGETPKPAPKSPDTQLNYTITK